MLHHMLRSAAGDNNEISVVNYTSFFTAATTFTITVNKPAGTTAGDLMVVLITKDAGGDTYTQPTGWTEIIDVGTSGRSFMIAYKVAESYEPANYTWTANFSGQQKYANIVTYRNARYDTGASIVYSSTTTSPGITVSNNNSWQILIGRTTAASATISFDGATTIISDSDVNAPSSVIQYKKVNSGATGATTGTFSTSTNSISALFSLTPYPPPNLKFKSSVISTNIGGTIVAPTGIVAGDLLVLYDSAAMNSGLPTAVTPSGFTTIMNNIASTNRRVICSYKIATGSESGTTITGMAVNNVIVKMLFVISTNGASVATVNSVQYDSGDNIDLPAQTITSGSGNAPLAAFGFSRNLVGNVGTFSPTPDDILVSGAHFGYYKLYNTNPSDSVVDTSDGGANNMLMSFYIEVL